MNLYIALIPISFFVIISVVFKTSFHKKVASTLLIYIAVFFFIWTLDRATVKDFNDVRSFVSDDNGDVVQLIISGQRNGELVLIDSLNTFWKYNVINGVVEVPKGNYRLYNYKVMSGPIWSRYLLEYRMADNMSQKIEVNTNESVDTVKLGEPISVSPYAIHKDDSLIVEVSINDRYLNRFRLEKIFWGVKQNIKFELYNNNQTYSSRFECYCGGTSSKKIKIDEIDNGQYELKIVDVEQYPFELTFRERQIEINR